MPINLTSACPTCPAPNNTICVGGSAGGVDTPLRRPITTRSWSISIASLESISGSSCRHCSANGDHCFQDFLAGRGRVHRRIHSVIAYTRHRVADREEHRKRQQQGWLADRLRAMDAVLHIAVLEQPDVEH